MISAGLAVEGQGVGGGLGPASHHHHRHAVAAAAAAPSSYMTYAAAQAAADTWHRQQVAVAAQQAAAAAAAAAAAVNKGEFLRPAQPKPLGNRYNGASATVTSLNGSRMTPATSPHSKYPSPPSSLPVNLTKDPPSPSITTSLPEEPPYSPAAVAAYRLAYQPYSGVYQSAALAASAAALATPYGPLYPSYGLGRNSFQAPHPPLSPLEATQQQFVAPQNYSPTLLKKEKPKTPNFKVPCGKEGSLKHRILTRPADAPKKRAPPLSPPATPTKTTPNVSATMTTIAGSGPTLNNNTLPGNFQKGSLIQLANGDLRKVEDMKTEDFVKSAESNPELRLAESTVVRIEENPIVGTVTVTLSYNQNRHQVEFESTIEHPYFVYGQGWASCHPDRTLQYYGLKVHRLQVGDIVVSLTPRETSTQTTTTQSLIKTEPSSKIFSSVESMTRTSNTDLSLTNNISRTVVHTSSASSESITLSRSASQGQENSQRAMSHSVEVSPLEERKRRWSAPEICDDDDCNKKRKDA